MNRLAILAVTLTVVMLLSSCTTATTTTHSTETRVKSTETVVE